MNREILDKLDRAKKDVSARYAEYCKERECVDYNICPKCGGDLTLKQKTFLNRFMGFPPDIQKDCQKCGYKYEWSCNSF